MHSSSDILAINGINLWYETFGNSTDPTLLLIMGNSSQAIMWPDEMCNKLTEENYYVIRFDNRDSGKSTCVDYSKDSYNLFDLANDALGLLDALKIRKAHIVGLSMGGSIAQLLARYHPERVISMTLMMTSPDISIKNDAFQGKDMSDAILPPPSKDFIDAVLTANQVPVKSRQDKIELIVNNWRLANGKKAEFNQQEWQQLITKTIEREESNPTANNIKVATQSNHTQAQIATQEPNLDTLKLIHTPTLVIHGKQDPVFPYPHGVAIAKQLENAKLLLIDEMGHALNPVFIDEITAAITKHCATGC